MDNQPTDWDRIWGATRGGIFSRLRKSLTAAIARRFAGLDGLFLEAGCGESHLLHHITAKTVGIDFSRAACKKSAQNGATVVRGNFHRLPFRPVFDTVFSQGVLQAENDPVLAARSMMNAVKPGGTLTFTLPKKYSVFHVAGKLENIVPIWPRVHQQYWSRQDVLRLFFEWNPTVEDMWYRQLFFVTLKRGE